MVKSVPTEENIVSLLSIRHNIAYTYCEVVDRFAVVCGWYVLSRVHRSKNVNTDGGVSKSYKTRDPFYVRTYKYIPRYNCTRAFRGQSTWVFSVCAIYVCITSTRTVVVVPTFGLKRETKMKIWR